jgi:hypothetical protein
VAIVKQSFLKSIDKIIFLSTIKKIIKSDFFDLFKDLFFNKIIVRKEQMHFEKKEKEIYF